MWNSIKSMFGMSPSETNLIDLKKLSKQELHDLVKKARKALKEKYKLNNNIREITWGKCGLKNLGNTCFMNAALQCMSNTEILTRYLLEKNWAKDINPVLTRSGGALLCEYYLLLKKIWCYDEDYVSPSGIKKTIVKVSSTFAGYSQQDSQEFLSYFLYVLMDDSNKIFIKPYIEKKDFHKETIQEFADRSWNYFKKRNVSFIVDFFYGQFYTEITCPHCDKKSLTCDPYSMISLNIKENDYVKFEGYILCQTYENKIFHFEFLVEPKMTLNNLIDYIFEFIENDEDIIFRKQNFISYFYRQSKIVKKIGNPAKITAGEIMKDKNILFLIEDFSRECLDIIYGNVSIENERRNDEEEGYKINLFFNEDDSNIGVERIIQVPKTTKVRDLYKWVFLIHRRVFKISEVKYCEELEEPFLKEFDLETILEKYYPDGTASYNSLFLLKVDRESKNNIKSLEPLFDNERRNIRVDILMNSDLRQRRYKLKTCSNIHVTDYVKTSSDISLQSCFKHFVTKEKLDSQNTWYCNKCKEHKEAYIKHSLLRMPNVLIIHLKRFKKKYHGNGYASFRKIHNYVDFEIENLDLSEFMIQKDKNGALYNLIGVINHYGSSGGGHYTAFCKNFLNGRWYHFDDSDCTHISQSEILTKAAYVLFYQKI